MKAIARNESGRTSKPGRDAQGRWTTDDTTIRDALTALGDAVAPVLGYMADPAMDAETRQRLAADGWQRLCDMRQMLNYVDVGQKPGKDET